MIFYPRCPECGEEASHRPVVVREGEACFFVTHSHRGCEVSRYVTCVTDAGRQSSELLDGRAFEDVMGDAA